MCGQGEERGTGSVAGLSDSDQLRLLIESIPDVILRVLADGRITFISRAPPGKTQAETVGTNAFDYLPPESRPLLARALHNAFDLGEPDMYTTRSVSDRTWDVRCIPLRQGNRTVSAVLIATNRSALVRAEEAVRDCQASHRILMEQSADAILIMDKEAKILDVNTRALEILGVTLEAVVGRNISELIVPEDLRAIPLRMPKVLAGETMRTTRRIRVADGSTLVLEGCTKLMPDGRVLCTVRDITAQRRSEERILELARREQQRTGEDLHDTLGQELSGIKYLVEALAARLRSAGSEHAEEAATVAEVVQSAIADTRRIARGLTPMDLSPEGLTAALRDLAATTREVFGVACGTRIRHPATVQSDAMATHLYQITREAIQNAVHHGKADRIIIQFSAGKTRGRLVVADNGSGFKGSAEKRDCAGLHIMRHRADLLNGELSVETSPGSGTVITCVFPNKART